MADAPFVKVEASKFTEVGYVGRDVESMVRDLVEQAINLVKNKKKIEIERKAAENANAALLDILIPPIRQKKQPDVFYPQTEGADSPISISEGTDLEVNERTRD